MRCSRIGRLLLCYLRADMTWKNQKGLISRECSHAAITTTALPQKASKTSTVQCFASKGFGLPSSFLFGALGTAHRRIKKRNTKTEKKNKLDARKA